jgi:predicted AAA+ superfamily ATPase
MYIARNQYLEVLKAARNNGLIKIVTGLRRCGKSYLLFKIFRKFLIEDGVSEDHIIGIALDDLENEHLRDGKTLLSHIRSLLKDGGMHYVLLDEVQLVEGFTDVLNRGFRVDVGNLLIRTTDKLGKTVRKSLEVDFIANIGNNRYYIQSAFDMPTREKIEQETRSLRSIGDSFKKIVIVKDRIKPRRDEYGILTLGLFDFLLHPESLDL